MNQNVAAEGDASLELSTNTVTITPDAVAKSEVITCPTANSELKSPLCVIVTSCLGAFAPLPAVTVAVVTRLELFRLGDNVQK